MFLLNSSVTHVLIFFKNRGVDTVHQSTFFTVHKCRRVYFHFKAVISNYCNPPYLNAVVGMLCTLHCLQWAAVLCSVHWACCIADGHRALHALEATPNDYTDMSTCTSASISIGLLKGIRVSLLSSVESLLRSTRVDIHSILGY